MKEVPVTFESQGLKLEGLLARPAGDASARAAVICHPHPQYGGSMYNNVVEAIVAAMETLGYATLRFNFRGVGESEGAYDNGRGEALDAAAAVRYLLAQPLVRRDGAILAGYSFGAMVALSAADATDEVSTVIAVAPPLAFGEPAMVGVKKRLVLIAGDRDSYCPANRLEALRPKLPAAVIRTIAGADHFFAGYEGQLTAALIAALQSG
jgi:uncharacterized protein